MRSRPCRPGCVPSRPPCWAPRPFPHPDTGGSTAATAEAVRRLTAGATALAGRLDTLAGDLDECLAVYAEADDDVFQALELRMAGALT